MARPKGSKNRVNGSNVVSLKTRPCATPNCEGKVGDNSVTGLCRNCYAVIYNWSNKRNNKDCVERFQRLSLSMSRMDLVLPDKDVQRLHDEFDHNNKRYQPLVVMPGKVSQYKKRSKTRYKSMSRERLTNYS